MGDKKFILFELHMDGDLQLGPRSIDAGGANTLPELIGREGSGDGDEDAQLESESGGGGRFSLAVGPGVAVLALALLAGIAFAVRFLLGGESPDEGDGEEVDVDVGE